MTGQWEAHLKRIHAGRSRATMVSTGFHLGCREILGSLLDEGLLKGLRTLLVPGHRERRFNLATLLWLGMYAAANAAKRSQEAILAAACELWRARTCCRCAGGR